MNKKMLEYIIIIIAIVLLIAFGPMILMFLLATLSAIFEVLTY